MESDLVELPADGRAAGLARAVVRDRLREWELDDLTDVAALLTTELVTNVLLHTSSAPALRVTREGDDVRVTVLDGSAVPPQPRWHSRTATTGRGMELMEKLADEWGWTSDGSGKAVWVTVSRSRQPARTTHRQADADEAGDGQLVSPLGRYAPADTATVPVTFLAMPVRVLTAAREHHDGLLREFRLLAMADGEHRPDVPARLSELVEIFGVRFADARPRPQVEAALEQGLDSIDLTSEVSPAAVQSAHGLEALLDEADGFCRSGHLVTPPRKPVLREFARWYLHQLIDQVAGRPPSPWNGPLDPD